jgi:DNA-binding transcriptional regulator YiaG
MEAETPESDRILADIAAAGFAKKAGSAYVYRSNSSASPEKVDSPTNGLSAPTSDTLLTPDKLRRVRERLGLTTGEFAGLLGVSEDEVAFWERGNTCPEPATIAKMKEMLREVKRKETPKWSYRLRELVVLVPTALLTLVLTYYHILSVEVGVSAFVVQVFIILYLVLCRIFRVDPGEDGPF